MNCLAQRKKFKNKHPVWADPNDVSATIEQDAEESPDETKGAEDSSSEEDDFDMHATDVRSKRLRLETKELRYKHLININNDLSYKGAIKGVQFHPKSKVALVTVSYGQTDLFEVDGERNRYLQNIKLPRTRTPFCLFKADGESIVISSEDYKGKFYTFDMVSGKVKDYSLKVGYDAKPVTDFQMRGEHVAMRKEGSQEIFILSSKTFENTHSIKINEPAKVLQFSSDNELYIAGENAHIYVWDLRKTSVCKHRFQDEGSVHSTSLAVSVASNQVSLGSDSGIVNSYQLDQCLENRFPTPIRTFSNLETSIDILKYNSSGELLLFGSSLEPGAFRMIHSHSGIVYRNFPIPSKKYGHLLSADFSPLSGYLGLGTSIGRAHLCRIPYYKSY